MGTTVYLIADGSRISPKAWEHVYLDSLHLLDGFPAPPMHLDVEQKGGWKRYVYSRQLVREEGGPRERWTICGDLASRRSAEDFVLFRHHAAQFLTAASQNKTASNRDILWVEPGEAIESFYGEGFVLWDSKTQDCPYHFAVLAVGMLIETRFPTAAYVIGDINRREAEHAAAWARGVLGESIALPVCVDSDRLCKRLLGLYGNQLPALRRFTTLFRGELHEEWETIARHVDTGLRHSFLATRLESLDSLGLVGASQQILSYLEATGDVEGLIESVHKVASARKTGGTAFSSEALLRTLCESAITIPPDLRRSRHRNALDPFKEIDPVLGKALQTFIDAIPSGDFYMPAEELLEHFSRAEPERRQRFSRIISSHDSAQKETDPIESMDKADESNTPVNDASPTGVRYIESIIAKQTPRRTTEEALALARTTGKELRNGSLLSPPLSEISDRDAILNAIYHETFQNSIVLTETAWQAIDSLKDLTVHKYLLGLAAINNRSRTFCDWRQYLLEEPRFWNALLEVAE
jgi:hypothetical protein